MVGCDLFLHFVSFATIQSRVRNHYVHFIKLKLVGFDFERNYTLSISMRRKEGSKVVSGCAGIFERRKRVNFPQEENHGKSECFRILCDANNFDDRLHFDLLEMPVYMLAYDGW